MPQKKPPSWRWLESSFSPIYRKGWMTGSAVESLTFAGMTSEDFLGTCLIALEWKG